MPRRDLYHRPVRHALEKDGWLITDDPFLLKVGKKRLAADWGVERAIAAQRGIDKIVVEIKSFTGISDIDDLEKALGQYTLYQRILEAQNIDRRLYLALPQSAYLGLFTIEIGQILLDSQALKLLVFDPDSEAIVQWIP
ncbi:MAG: hypothetical protein Fur0042_29290 [Cyanophyceae cyanobacterium]